MRIAILRLNAGNFGKIGFYNVQEIGLARALQALGHETLVFYLDQTIDSPKELGRDNVVYLPCKAIGVHGIFDVNILDSYNLQGLILFADNQLWQKNLIDWCDKKAVKCLCYFGRIETQSDRVINKIFYKYLLRRNTPAFQKSINVTKTVNTQKAMTNLHIPVQGVIPVGLDMSLLYPGEVRKEEIRRTLNLPDNKRVLLFVGRLEPNKKSLYALEILKSLLEEDENYYLVIIGNGSQKENLEKMIVQKGLSEDVRFLESIPNTEIYQYYKAGDCLINLCDVEIFGMTILESMYYGCPVVAIRADGPCDIIENGVSGVLCDSYDLEEWKQSIQQAVGNPKMVENAHQLIIDRFNWEVSAKQFEKYLQT